MKILLVGLAAIVIVAFVEAHPSLRIAGGKDAVRNQFPYQVLVNDANGNIAGGVIIGSRWVVSSAKAVVNAKPRQLKVVAGVLKKSDTDIDNEQSLDVVQIITHPEYNAAAWECNIALLRLSSLLINGSNVQLLPLPPKGYQASGLGTITGWGSITMESNIPDILQFAYVKILSNAECKKVVPQIGMNFTNNVLCSEAPISGGTQAGCGTDYGGALAADGYLVGVISHYPDCKSPTAYTNVSSVREWILDNTNGEVVG